MNGNRIRPRECSFRSAGNAQLQLLSSCWGNCSPRGAWSAGPPLQRARKNNHPDSLGSCVSPEGASRSLASVAAHHSGTGSRCVGSTPGAFYAAERLMGFPHLECQPGTAKDSLELPSLRSPEAQLYINIEKQDNSFSCTQGTLESLVKFPVQGSYNATVLFDDEHRFPHGNPQNCVVSIVPDLRLFSCC